MHSSMAVTVVVLRAQYCEFTMNVKRFVFFDWVMQLLVHLQPPGAELQSLVMLLQGHMQPGHRLP